MRNLQGDIIAVANADGEVVIEYTYDPWGKIDYQFTSNDAEENEALQMLVGIFCPLTYRGYNYDFTTGLYYLQSRYYNPEWGRFLNVDDTSVLLATQGETHNANLFAYCNNNPVNRVDYTGHWGEDVHNGYYAFSAFANSIGGKKYGTYYWALTAGFSKNNAEIVAYHCFDVDSQFPAWIPTKSNQAWHFNVNKGTSRSDSRLELFVFFALVAEQYFSLANQYYVAGKEFLAAIVLADGLKYLGYAIHPIQDIFAHTDEVVEYKTTLGVGYYSHLSVADVDNAEVHKDVIFDKVEPITLAILHYFTNIYYDLLQNVEGVELDVPYIIM